MSVISNTHNIVNYDPKKSSAFAGQRLAKVTYKTDKETGIKKESKCVSIPMIKDDDIVAGLDRIIAHIKAYLEGQQDAIVRTFVDAGKENITDDDLSIDSIGSFLDAESSGGRLSKEIIGSWFDNNLHDTLTVAFADKLGLSNQPTMEEMNRVQLATAIYKDKLSALAGGKTSYDVETAKKLLAAVKLAPEGDDIAGKFIMRLEKMMVVPSADMLAL